MNKTLEKFARDTLKENLAWLDLHGGGHIRIFKRMYSANNLELPIGKVVDNMPSDKLDWAMTQVQNSIDGLHKE